MLEDQIREAGKTDFKEL